MSGLSVGTMRSRKRLVGFLLFAIACFATVAVVSLEWGDQRVSPTFVSTRFRMGDSMETVRAGLPLGLPSEIYAGPPQSWLVSKAGIGDLFTRQHEIVLQFDEDDRLLGAYSTILIRNEEITRAIPLRSK